MKKRTAVVVCVFCLLVFTAGALMVGTHRRLLMRPMFQQKTAFHTPSLAKYEKDGNLYVIDNDRFRISSMTPDGHLNYEIITDRTRDNTRFYDCAADDAGNLYVYAMEAETDTFLTRRDLIRKYDRDGTLLQDILVVDHTRDLHTNPRTFPQFNSLRTDTDSLTFSRIQKGSVTLYRYDTARDVLTQSVWTDAGDDYTVAQLVLKDFANYLYATRDGDLYEVKDGAEPALKASFEYTRGAGGTIPWFLFYEEAAGQENILLFNAVTATLQRLYSDGTASEVLPKTFFNTLQRNGTVPQVAACGFYKDRCAGVYGDVLWYYDGSAFHTYDTGITLSLRTRASIALTQIAFAVALIALFGAFAVLFGNCPLWVRLTLATLPLMIIAYVIVDAVLLRSMASRTQATALTELRLASTALAQTVDGDAVAQIQSNKDISSDAYRSLQKTLGEVTTYYAAIHTGATPDRVLLASTGAVGIFTPASLPSTVGAHDTLLQATQPVRGSDGEITGMLVLAADITGALRSNRREAQRLSLVVLALCLGVVLVPLVFIRVRGGTRAAEGMRPLSIPPMPVPSPTRFVPTPLLRYAGLGDEARVRPGNCAKREMAVLCFSIRASTDSANPLSTATRGIADAIFREYHGFVDADDCNNDNGGRVLFPTAQDAVKASIALSQRFRLNPPKAGGERLSVSVGIHYDAVFMGISEGAGTDTHLSATVIVSGEARSSRLESFARQTASGVLISREAFKQIPQTDSDFQHRFIGMIRSIGANELTGVFEVLDALPEAIRKRRLATKRLFESGVRKYHTKDYEAAKQRFAQVVKADSADVWAVHCLAETVAHLKNPTLPGVFSYNSQ